jgi:hypothetical protein
VDWTVALPDPARSLVAQKTHLGAQAFHLVEQIEHGLERGQIKAADDPQILNLSQGMNGFFREFHCPVWWLNDWSDKASATIDQNRSSRDTREMSSGIKAVQDIWLRLI